jgi:hypothetical protein
MCAFLSHGISELNYPVVDREYPPGQVVIILSEAEVGSPHMSVLWQVPVMTVGKPIWITATEVTR